MPRRVQDLIVRKTTYVAAILWLVAAATVVSVTTVVSVKSEERPNRPGSKRASSEIPSKSTQEGSSESTKRYTDIAELNCHASLLGQSAPSSSAGFTLAAIKSRDGKSRFIISAAYGGATKRVPELRAVAKDAQGKRHIADSETKVSAAGLALGVITLECEYSLPPESIDRLVIQEEKN